MSFFGDVLGQVIAGILAAGAVSGLSYYIGRYRALARTSRTSPVLPGAASELREGARHRWLSGEWYQYYLTSDPGPTDHLCWKQGVQVLEVQESGRVVGETRIQLAVHPFALDYKVHGEIRGNRLILTDRNERDVTEFASVIFPSLRDHARPLVGLWTGMDNEGQLLSGPIVLCRSLLTSADLNRLTASAGIRLAAIPGEYRYCVPMSRVEIDP